MIKERLEALRQEMKKENLSAYIIPTSDAHETEYVCDYYACRQYMSGFTGSAGILVVGMEKAALWTDGRYFIQAANQLAGSTIELMKMGNPETPSIPAYITDMLKAGQTAGFDGKVINWNLSKKYERLLRAKNIKCRDDIDLVARIWKDRPALPSTPTFAFEEKYAGRSCADKLQQLRHVMEANGCNSHITTKIDEIAWLYNLRAHDIPYFPVALAYTIVMMDKAIIYMDGSRLDQTSRQIFEQNGIIVKGYHEIYEDVRSLSGCVMIDPEQINSTLANSITADIYTCTNPIIGFKSIKNDVEITNTKQAHIYDGVACTKFMYWLKKNVKDTYITEMSASDHLNQLRREQPGYIEDSFATISAYKEHAAMMHYHSEPETDTQLLPEGLYLVDSGGHYFLGTTDITRTYVLGPVTDQEKKWFTLALQGHIRLEKAHWLYGCRGINLDILARGPLWDRNMDYQCGTGHGVGHVLSVHEAPNGIRWRIVPERNDSGILEAGMITSDEPGVYMEGQFGIRHENEVLAVNGQQNEYGQFMHFECLTFVPFDREGIDPSLLTKEETAWLNDYHQQVFEKISPYLTEEESAWLKEICRPL